VQIESLTKFTDARGWLAELFRADELGVDPAPVMAYVSSTRPGAVRGPHEHRRQTDRFCFLGTSAFRLHLWDNRPDSPTYGLRYRHDFVAGELVSVVISPGVVHAYENIGTVDGLIVNAPDRLYAGRGRKDQVDEIRHEDNPDSKFRIES
jgi:dTDP-4-dehydrorhamnose 3,5-epimerase